MARKKKETLPPPPASVRPIHCGFCQKELNPATDQITFIGVGKWRDGPGFVHAVCSPKTPDDQDNPCFLSGISWATNILRQQPVCMTFEEWKARPVRRHILATRAANGRYDLQLNEAHLNCYHFLETKRSPNATKAKEIVERWQAAWGLESDDIPDIDKMEQDALSKLHAREVLTKALEEQPAVPTVEMPEALKEELHRHSTKAIEHLLANIHENGDDCK